MIENLVQERAAAAGLKFRRRKTDGMPSVAPAMSGGTIWRAQHTGERGMFEALSFIAGYMAGVGSER